jgi:hypothetical protein
LDLILILLRDLGHRRSSSLEALLLRSLDISECWWVLLTWEAGLLLLHLLGIVPSLLTL